MNDTNQHEQGKVGVGEGLKAMLKEKGARYSLDILGQSMDRKDISVDRAQIAFDFIAPGHSLSGVADKYRPRFYQRHGWKGILMRFAKENCHD